MKLDYELIRSILENVESESDGFSWNYIFKSAYKEEHYEEFVKLAYHYNILIDNGFMTGNVTVLRSFGNAYPVKISFSSLELQGHNLLESMANETLWNKVKDNLQSVGVENLKQIPSLALQLLSSGG